MHYTKEIGGVAFTYRVAYYELRTELLPRLKGIDPQQVG